VKGTIACIGIFVALLFMTPDALVGAGSYPGQTRGTAAAAPNAGAEACSVLKKEDVAVALGGTVSGPKATGPDLNLRPLGYEHNLMMSGPFVSRQLVPDGCPVFHPDLEFL